MAASTIPNSGGPGSSIELSPVTIAVRDKVIEKFADQPLDAMNESVKQLLSREEDEQKRLGILAARVYILRQRISRIAEGDLDRVVGSAAPKASDLMTGADHGADDGAGGEPGSGEWTRLRILDDCEVNGVRFPKTVIIDVKTEDANKLIASGSAELVEEDPASSAVTTDAAAADAAASEASDPISEEADPSADITETDETANDTAEDTVDDGDDLSALSAALEDAPAPQMEVEEPPQQADEAVGSGDEDVTGEAVIDAPSAAEVTAALEALSNGDDGGATTDSSAAPAEAEAEAETAVAEDNADDAADVAAELEALSAALAPEGEAAPEAEEDAGEAAAVAAELEAAAAAMAAGPSNPDTTDLPPAGGEEDAGSDDDENADKPAGWFEAQQNAEAAKRDEDKSDDENA